MNPTLVKVEDEILEFAKSGNPADRADVIHAANLFAIYIEGRAAEQFADEHPLLTPPRFELEVSTRRRYLRIAMEGRSVHCFIDATNGDILKAATWKAPAKDARCNLFDSEWLLEFLERFHWAGGHLYKR
jgi:hypothetical protein